MFAPALALDGVEDLLRFTAGRAPGREARLDRFPRLLARFRAAHPLPATVVKVAGTNGKGSVAALLEAAARHDGPGVGMFTSPHLVRVTERVRVDGAELTAGELDAAVRSVAPLLRRAVADEGPAAVPSFFEGLLVAALAAFAARGVRLAVVEAGVGGGNDVVSLLPSPLAAVTTVGLDHVDELGGTLASVAADKAAIADVGSTLVLGPGVAAGPPEALDAVRRVAHSRDVTLVEARRDALDAEPLGLAGYRVRLRPDDGVSVPLPLAGDHQLDNLATVVALVDRLAALGAVAGRGCLAGLAGTAWPGRLDHRPGPPAWLLDAAHNPQAVAALADAVPALLAGRRPTLVYGASAAHDVAGAMALLPRLGDRIHLVDGFHGAVGADELRRHLPPSVHVVAAHASPAAARAAVDHDRARSDVALAFGSLFLVGALGTLLPRPAL